MKLVLVGVSHHHAPVELRERAALELAEAAALARALAVGREAVVLSTCNRTEIYAAGDDAEAAALEALRSRGGDELACVAYRLTDHAAALHLFRVAAGLDSLVPGEGEILGQVRAAYEAGAPGPLLNRLFHDATRAGKRARSQTTIGESPSSVPAAGAALAQQVFGDLAGRSVLVIGAGAVGELAARGLATRGATIAAVASRSIDRARELADRFGAEASGLDSMIIGEGEILGQVREAWNAAEHESACGPSLSRTFRHAVEVGKRARTETAIGRHAVSVSSAAVALATSRLGSLDDRRVLVLGAGSMGEGMALAIAGAGVEEIVVANRTAQKADELAARVGGRAITLDEIPDALVACDVLLASPGSQDLLVERSAIESVMQARGGRALLVVDIGVPRNIDPGAGEVFGVTLLDIDDLRAFGEQSLAQRRQEIGHVREIIAEELDRHRLERTAREVAPIVTALRAHVDDLRDGELERHPARLDALDPAARDAVEQLTRSIVNKILHEPTVRVKDAAGTARGELYADALVELFGLDAADPDH